MKKLMLAMVVVACAVSAQANLTLKMNNYYDGDDTVGYYSAFGLNTAEYTVETMTSYLKSDYKTNYKALYDLAYEQSAAKNIYGAFSKKSGSGTSYLQASNTRASTIGIVPGDYFTVIQYYSAADDEVAFRVVGMGKGETSTFQDYGTVVGTWGEWTAVPEPTSGLLMLLGVAGLALKRKRA